MAKQDKLTKTLINIERVNQYKVRQDIASYNYALSLAQDNVNRNKQNLLQYYNDVTNMDSTVNSLVSLRTNKIQATPFKLVNSNDKINNNAQTLFEGKWFMEFCNYYVETIFFGFSLVQYSFVNGELKFELISRSNVDGVNKNIVDYSNQVVESYIPYMDFLFEIGEPKCLGDFSKITSYAIRKKGVIAFWNETAEIFGSPLRIGKTKSQNPEDIEKFKAGLQKMGSSAWALLQDEDEINFVEQQKTDAFQIYNQLLTYIDNEYAKQIIGGTEITSGGSGGSEARANVHNEQFEYITKFDLRKLKFYINENIIPRFKAKGILKGDVIFDWINEERMTMTEKINIDKIANDILVGGQIDPQYIADTYKIVLNNERTEPVQQPA